MDFRLHTCNIVTNRWTAWEPVEGGVTGHIIFARGYAARQSTWSPAWAIVRADGIVIAQSKDADVAALKAMLAEAA